MFRLRRTVYLDNNATTPVTRAVRRAVGRVLRRCYGNPSSLYRVARSAAAVLEDSRSAVAAAVGAEPREILFTGSATEANNQVLKGLAGQFRGERSRIVSTPVEHASVGSTLGHLAGQGIEVAYCPVDRYGRADLAALARLVDERTFLVSAMLANNELGTVQDVARIAGIARERGALIHSDCVQALGKIPVDVKALGVDYATFSAHKVHGPKGVGALYARSGAPLVPFVHGGHQESGLRAGTEGLHNIAGFAAACAGLPAMLARTPQVLGLTRALAAGLRELKPDLSFHTPEEGGLPNTLSVTLPGVSNALLMGLLDSRGISVSAGSACNTQEDLPSHVLTAIGLSAETARQTLRVSLSDRTSMRDVRYALREVRDFVEDRTSPITLVSPAQLDEDLLLSPATYILDVRFWYDRKVLKGLPNSHEAPFFTFHRHIAKVPRDRNVLVVCQMGYNSPMVAYHLRAKGYRNVGFLVAGLVGWRLVHGDLYAKLAGRNVTRID